jgi:competence protein ComGC
LTQALRKFSVERQQVPTSLNELVATGYLQKLPPPPPGKMFRIDTKNVRVVAK